ncbi:hypothetical protein [Pseudomonas syringae]|nr:hypothetical protein [Pseudomonas syringae]
MLADLESGAVRFICEVVRTWFSSIVTGRFAESLGGEALQVEV